MKDTTVEAAGIVKDVISPPSLFHAITMDSILALPMSSEGFDSAISVTNKYSKYITFISGKTTWGAEEWAIELLDQLNRDDWGLPGAILSNQDQRFIAELWGAIFMKLKVDLLQRLGIGDTKVDSYLRAACSDGTLTDLSTE